MVLVLILAVCIGAATYLIHELRRRSRLAAVARTLQERERRRRWVALMRGGEASDWADSLAGVEDAEWNDEMAAGMAVAQADVHAATRALMVSLEAELGRESQRARRVAHPACRRASLRVAGRAPVGRRSSPRPARRPPLAS